METGDTKAGTLIGTDKFDNKYYENMTDELPRMEASSAICSNHQNGN